MASLSDTSDQPPAKRAKLHGDGPMEAFEQKVSLEGAWRHRTLVD